jgi:hypothetical protein
VRPSITMSVEIFYDELGKNMSIKGKPIMECFIAVKPKEVISNCSKNLKSVMLGIGHIQIGSRE